MAAERISSLKIFEQKCLDNSFLWGVSEGRQSMRKGCNAKSNWLWCGHLKKHKMQENIITANDLVQQQCFCFYRLWHWMPVQTCLQWQLSHWNLDVFKIQWRIQGLSYTCYVQSILLTTTMLSFGGAVLRVNFTVKSQDRWASWLVKNE